MDIGSVRDACSVCFIDTGRINQGWPIPARCLDQNSARVPGLAETADHFGQSVAFLVDGLVDGASTTFIGAPGEDIVHFCVRRLA